MEVLVSQFDRISDEIRSVRAALSLYVGGALPPDLQGIADANGLPTGGWVFPPSAPVAGRFEALSADLAGAGDVLRDRAQQAGLRMLVPGDPGWPAGTGADELPCLWVAGDPDVADALRKAVTATGAVDASAYGLHIASDLAVGLAGAQWTLVTGADTRGVDAAAARGALAARGRLLLVAARGVDRFHIPPASDARLSTNVTLVSPFPPGADPLRGRFAVHQHLMGTFGTATVIVEETQDGPALAVARAAASNGRAVCAVPGAATSSLSRGCHQLLAGHGAHLVEGASGVLAAISSQLPPAPPGDGNLYRITGVASWDDGRWRTRQVPDFHVVAGSARAAADLAYEVVFAATDARGATLDAGVFGPDGSHEAVQVSSTS
jgi:DNA processing protein